MNAWTTLAAVAGDIRDVRGPVPIPGPASWGAYVAVGAALALAGAVAFLVWRRRRRIASTAHGRAFARLNEAKPLMRPEESRAFALAVSEAVRDYLRERFRLPADQRTTQEFLHVLSARPPAQLRDHLLSLKEFLEFCDLAKFGGWRLSGGQIDAMHICAWRLIATTRMPEEGKKS